MQIIIKLPKCGISSANKAIARGFEFYDSQNNLRMVQRLGNGGKILQTKDDNQSQT